MVNIHHNAPMAPASDAGTLALEHGDFTEAITQRPEPADGVWTGLSLHHLTQRGKCELMDEIRWMLAAGGRFMTYEPTCVEGEERDGFLARSEALARSQFTAFAANELDALIDHVRSSDYPETMASWKTLGRDAGFAKTEHLFTCARNLMRMFCFTIDPRE